MRLMAVDGTVDLVTVYGDRQADQAHLHWLIQYDWAEGYHGDEALGFLPAVFAGRRVVRDPRELAELAREGQFDITEVYAFMVGWL
jgi:hypothetical protein